MVLNLSRGEGGRVHRYFIDGTVEVVSATPTAISTNTPVAPVVLAPHHVGIHANAYTVNEEFHALSTHAADDLMPLVVVVRLRTLHDSGTAGVDTEVQPARAIQVNVAVVVA